MTGGWYSSHLDSYTEIFIPGIFVSVTKVNVYIYDLIENVFENRKSVLIFGKKALIASILELCFNFLKVTGKKQTFFLDF